MHIGVASFSGLVRQVCYTTANLADVTVTHALLHGSEDSVFGDGSYKEAKIGDEVWQYRFWQCGYLLALGIYFRQHRGHRRRLGVYLQQTIHPVKSRCARLQLSISF